MIQKIISQQYQFNNDITTPIDTLEVAVDVTTDSIYWFTPYKSSDFPEITCDKDYFFLWSTDHDSGAGGIWWGKGNNLDLSDFVEVAKITDGYQAETPFLYRFPNATRPISLYYHTLQTNPINSCSPASQETNLITTTGGTLDGATWVQETNPLGCQGTVGSITQNHVGYLRFWNLGGTLIGNHHFQGSVPLTFQRSTSSDGLSWTHQTPYTQYNPFLEAGRSYNLSWGLYFTRGDKYYGIVNSSDDLDSFSGGSVPTGKIHLVEVNTDLEIINIVKTLNDNQQSQGWSFYLDNNTIHCYRQTGRTDKPLTFSDFLGYATLDISML